MTLLRLLAGDLGSIPDRLLMDFLLSQLNLVLFLLGSGEFCTDVGVLALSGSSVMPCSSIVGPMPGERVERPFDGLP